MTILGTFPRPLGWLAVTWLFVSTVSFLGFARFQADFGSRLFNIGLHGVVFGPALFLAGPWARRFLIWFTHLGFIFTAMFISGVLDKDGLALWVGLAFASLVLLLLIIQREVLLRPDVQRYFDTYGRAE